MVGLRPSDLVWNYWVKAERSKEEVPAPSAPGSSRHPVLEDAPGSYVLDT